jgi:hypothetical protein
MAKCANENVVELVATVIHFDPLAIMEIQDFVTLHKQLG